MKKIIALALVLVMLFALSACGKKEEAPVSTVAPVVDVAETEAPVIEAIEPVEEPEATPEPTPTGIEPDSGMHTISSDVNAISFEYDSKYVAMQNQLGNITVFAGTDTEMPYVTVSVMSDTDAVSYLEALVEGAKIELGNAMVTAPSAPAAVTVGEKEVYAISYSYTAEGTEGNIACAYYAEDLANGAVAVYNYIAIDGQSAEVEGIIKHAIETLSIAE